MPTASGGQWPGWPGVGIALYSPLLHFTQLHLWSDSSGSEIALGTGIIK